MSSVKSPKGMALSVMSESSAGKILVIGVLASGRGSNLQAIIDAIESGRLLARIGIVLSNKKEAHALKRAKTHQIPSVFVDPGGCPSRKSYDNLLYNTLKAHHVEFVVLAGYMRLLTSQLIGPYCGRIINVHPSLLPSFTGLHAQRQALAYGVKVSGCTIHFVDEEMDHGPVIAQATIPVCEGDTESILADRILVEEHRLLPEVIQQYAEGRLSIEGRVVHASQKTPTGTMT